MRGNPTSRTTGTSARPAVPERGDAGRRPSSADPRPAGVRRVRRLIVATVFLGGLLATGVATASAAAASGPAADGAAEATGARGTEHGATPAAPGSEQRPAEQRPATGTTGGNPSASGAQQSERAAAPGGVGGLLAPVGDLLTPVGELLSPVADLLAPATGAAGSGSDEGDGSDGGEPTAPTEPNAPTAPSEPTAPSAGETGSEGEARQPEPARPPSGLLTPVLVPVADAAGLRPVTDALRVTPAASSPGTTAPPTADPADPAPPAATAPEPDAPAGATAPAGGTGAEAGDGDGGDAADRRPAADPAQTARTAGSPGPRAAPDLPAAHLDALDTPAGAAAAPGPAIGGAAMEQDRADRRDLGDRASDGGNAPGAESTVVGTSTGMPCTGSHGPVGSRPIEPDGPAPATDSPGAARAEDHRAAGYLLDGRGPRRPG